MFLERLIGIDLIRLKRTLQMGFKSILSHKLRSFLTVLGIIFGVCSVIAMLAIGEGASHEAQAQIRELGANNIIVRSVEPPDDRGASDQQSRVIEYGVTYDDVRRIREVIPGISIIVPGRNIRTDLWNADRRLRGVVAGTVPWFPEMSNSPVVYGRFFNDDEMDQSLNVAVLDRTTAGRLFPLDNPVGNTVRVERQYYRVIGVIDDRHAANNDSEGAAGTHRMFIPLTASRNRFGEIIVEQSAGSRSMERVELHEAIVRVDDQEQVVNVAGIIQDLMERYHNTLDYEIIVPLELLRQAEQTQRIFNIVLGSIAAISLIVGGIGIMNIMLASVTERTREIGVRRALGAKRKDIITQFLIETVLLSATGGIVGVVLGVTIPFVISYFADMATIVTLWAPLVAFTISAMVGVIFGIYPAMRAADMDPVEALRHE